MSSKEEVTREEWAIDVLLREGFDVNIGKCFIRYPSRPTITPKAQESVDFLVEHCQHTVIPSCEDYELY